MKSNFTRNEYKKPVLKTHGTLEEMTMGSLPMIGSGVSCDSEFLPTPNPDTGFCEPPPP